MKQVLQSLSNGSTTVAEVPCPSVRPGHMLIRTRRSLVSAGTERMLVEFGRAGLIEKARQQPEKVREVLDKIRTDGLLPTLDAVRSKLDQPLALGYCNAGVVLEVGSGVEGFEIGERVVSNGSHAEVVCVPQNLCARIPADVDDEAAAFTVLGAVALQGVRLAQPTLGECFVVTGLGLVGLLTAQILRAHGCRVLGLDLNPRKAELARGMGVEAFTLPPGEDPLPRAMAFSRGRGVDGVLITAATKSNEPVHHAARMCRNRGRIVLVGVTGLELSRSDFYEKELTFQVSCSYGPGRYDPAYEDDGHDYPLGFVRWTEQRNFEAFLDMLATGQVDVRPLVSHRFSIADAAKAYELLGSEGGHLGIVLEYPDSSVKPTGKLRARTLRYAEGTTRGPVTVGLIGAGNYASRVLAPALRRAGADIKTIACHSGVSGAHLAGKLRAQQATTNLDAVFADSDVDAVVIATRHNSHADLVCRALDAGKHVFVEKPLALTHNEVDSIEQAFGGACESGSTPVLMVGLNRRAAPLVVRMRELLQSVAEPKTFIVTVNAGVVPPGHWTQDPEVGGGRIIGEGCHFVDLLRFLVGAPIEGVRAQAVGASPGLRIRDDKATIALSFADGSVGTIHYFGNGHKGFPKERIEAFGAGRVLQLDNFRQLRGWGWPSFRVMRQWTQDKGQVAWAGNFVAAVRDGSPAPVPFEELLEVARATINAAGALRSRQNGRAQ